MFKKLFVSVFLISIIAAWPGCVQAQTDSDLAPAVHLNGWQPTILVDCPTAGTMRRGSFDIILRAYPNGGLLGATDIGLSNRLMLGISFGAEGVVAEERPNWNPRPEYNIKLSLVDEGYVFPAIALGFSSQGYGSHHDDLDRYTFKSKGFYLVGSKNYPFYNWQVGLHAGVNYSMEHEDDDDNLDFYVGFDSRFNKDIGLVMEYDFATNDDKDLVSFGKGHGYLNLALQWLYADNLVMEVLLKNLVSNRKGVTDIWRGLRVTYVDHF